MESNGTVFLRVLFDGAQEDVEGLSDLSIEDIAFALYRGGWPASIKLKGAAALRMAMDYVEAVINYDVSRIDNVEKKSHPVACLRD